MAERRITQKKSMSYKQRRLRRTTLRAARLLYEDPVTIGRAIEILGTMLKKKQLTTRAFYRIFNAPLSPQTLKAKLKAFVSGKLSFEQFMEQVEVVRSRSVPTAEINAVIKCKKTEFYGKALTLATKYSSPKSLMTALTIRRMRYLRLPASEIEEAKRLKWKIHHEAHKLSKAQKEGNKTAMAEHGRNIRELENAFIDKFTKQL